MEHVDVLIVGAGLSGIGAAVHLQRECPGATYAVLEARGAIGGTWDLFRYPGVRSDSDMHTLGYSFKPWTGRKAIADGPSILAYVRETAREHGVEPRIRLRHEVRSAEWSSADARWTVAADRADTGETVRLTCRWLSVCAGYYRHDEGYRPRFAGEERFGGRFVHPQAWPDDLDVRDRDVVVVGSGATAVTLVPSLAAQGARVTMLQRTPSYVMSLPARDPVAEAVRRALPARFALPLVRWKNLLLTIASYQFSRRRPAAMRRFLRKTAVGALPPGYDVDTHFNPPYDPWDQRMCLVPDGDLFRAIASGRATVVTDRIAGFTERGVALRSGQEIPADVVVTATGLNLRALGGMRLTVDGAPVELSETISYKGAMVSGVPNLSLTIGYTNASWTLKADLINRFVCRVLRHMDARGYDTVVPVPPAGERGDRPFLELTSGYVRRGAADLPRQGARAPWRLNQNYLRDLVLFRRGPVADGALRFTRRARVTRADGPVAETVA